MTAVLVVVALAVGVALGAAVATAVGRRIPGDEPTTVPIPADEVEPEPGPAEAAAELLLRLDDALEHVEQGVVVCDGDGVELFRNRVAQSFLDARDGRVLVDSAIRDLLVEAAAGRRVVRPVDLFGPPAQSYVVTGIPFEGGSTTGALVLVEDRSLQRRTETVRRDFVANISHELKTPIGALGLLAETIRDEPDNEVVSRLAERMITEADRAGCTVDDLLELSRIEFGDDAEFGDVQAISVVGEAVARISSAAENAGVEVSVEVDPELVVHGDRRQLVSALFNLLDNAVKYSPPESEVVVAATSASGRVELTVADSGVGIPRRDLDRVFERFYRVDRARSRGTGGTGLGLAIVRHVASNHQGEVSVDSTEGVGSTFTLSLPLPDSPGPASPSSASPPSDSPSPDRAAPVPVPDQPEPLPAGDQ